MADVTVEFGATDTGLEKTLKAIQDELTQLKGKVSSGELSMTELESTMKRIGQITSMEKNIKAIGDQSSATSPKVEELGKDMKVAGDKGEDAGEKGKIGLGKIGIAAGIAGAAVKVGSKAMELAFDAARKVVQGFSDALDLGGRLSELSTQTGEAAGTLLVLETAFKNSGLEASQVGVVINKLQNFMQDAANGGEKQTKAMSNLGISMSDLAGKTPIQQMGIFAQKIAAIEDPTLRAAMASEVFGEKLGGKLLPLLVDFAGNIEDARGKVGSLERVMNDNAKAFDAAGETISAIAGKLVAFAAGILEKALPAVSKFMTMLSSVDGAAWGGKLVDYVLKIADMFIGAIKDPIEYISAYVTSFEVVYKTLGNGLLNAMATAASFMLEALSSNLPSAIVQFIGAAFTDVALSFSRYLTEGMMTFASALSNLPGFKEAGEEMFSFLDKANSKLGEQQEENIGKQEEAARKVVTAFTEATGKTRVFKEDIFGAGEATDRMNVKMKALEESGKATRLNFQGTETSTSKTADNVRNAADNSNIAAINFGKTNSSSYTAAEYSKVSKDQSVLTAVEWSKVAGSAYTAEKSTKAAAAEMVKTAREMSQADMSKLFSQAKQDLRDMGGDMEILGKKVTNIPQLAEALGIETASKSSKILIQEIGAEIKKIGKEPIAINIKFSPEKFAAGLVSLRTSFEDAFQDIPSTINAAPSIAEQAIDATKTFARPIPLNLDGYDSIADAKQSALDNFANPIPLNVSGDSAANEVLAVVQSAFTSAIPLSLDGSNAAAQALQTAENTFAAPINTSLSLDTSSAVQTATRNLGSIPTTLDADKSVKGLRDSVADGIELDVAAKSGATGLLEAIKTAVEAIKTAVLLIEPKLPIAVVGA